MTCGFVSRDELYGSLASGVSIRVTACPDDVQIACGLRLNLLLHGSAAGVERLLLAIAPTMARPVVVWRPGTTMLLPALPSDGTLLVLEVGRLSPSDQLRLYRRLTIGGPTPQIISTSTRPLLPLVLDGTFLEGLFYRLNTVCVGMG